MLSFHDLSRSLDYFTCIRLATAAASLALPAFTTAFPDDHQPTLLLDALGAWIADPTPEMLTVAEAHAATLWARNYRALVHSHPAAAAALEALMDAWSSVEGSADYYLASAFDLAIDAGSARSTLWALLAPEMELGDGTQEVWVGLAATGWEGSIAELATAAALVA